MDKYIFLIIIIFVLIFGILLNFFSNKNNNITETEYSLCLDECDNCLDNELHNNLLINDKYDLKRKCYINCKIKH